MNHLRSLMLSLPVFLCALLPPIGADAKTYSNDLQTMAAAREAGVSITATIQPTASSSVLQKAAQEKRS